MMLSIEFSSVRFVGQAVVAPSAGLNDARPGDDVAADRLSLLAPRALGLRRVNA
jgi:hypothetical protein